MAHQECDDDDDDDDGEDEAEQRSFLPCVGWYVI